MKIRHLEHVARYWDNMALGYDGSHPEFRKRGMHPSWGLWHIPEATLGLLRGVMSLDCTLVELGCGQGHDAVGFAELGARVVGIDISTEQLSRAIPHPRVQYMRLAAENMPFNDASVDIITSDHGAFDHSPPAPLLNEVYRLLRPGGTLVICTYSPIAFCCLDYRTGKLGTQLIHRYPTGSTRFDGQITSSEQSYQTWIQAFIAAGFHIERLEELTVASGSPAYFDELVEASWASEWPTDIAWVVRKPL